MGTKALNKKIDLLPPHLQKEVLDYAEFLIKKYTSKKTKRKFKFKWEGALSALNPPFTSVELQHSLS